MKIGRVMGNVTLTRRHPLLDGMSLRLVEPLSRAMLEQESGMVAQPSRRSAPDTEAADREAMIAVDPHGAGEEGLVLLAEGPDASQPYRPLAVPIDAYVAGIIDSLHLASPPANRSRTNGPTQQTNEPVKE